MFNLPTQTRSLLLLNVLSNFNDEVKRYRVQIQTKINEKCFTENNIPTNLIYIRYGKH